VDLIEINRNLSAKALNSTTKSRVRSNHGPGEKTIGLNGAVAASSKKAQKSASQRRSLADLTFCLEILRAA
jgi:hypothetical protein